MDPYFHVRGLGENLHGRFTKLIPRPAARGGWDIDGGDVIAAIEQSGEGRHRKVGCSLEEIRVEIEHLCFSKLAGNPDSIAAS